MTVNCDSIWLNRHSSCHGLVLTLILKRLKSPKGSWKRNSLEVYSLPLFLSWSISEIKLRRTWVQIDYSFICGMSHGVLFWQSLYTFSLEFLIADQLVIHGWWNFSFLPRILNKIFFSLKFLMILQKQKRVFFVNRKKGHIATYLHKALSIISV